MSKFKGTVIEYAQIQILKFRLEGIDYPMPTTLAIQVLANEIERCRKRKHDKSASR